MLGGGPARSGVRDVPGIATPTVNWQGARGATSARSAPVIGADGVAYAAYFTGMFNGSDYVYTSATGAPGRPWER
jgi:hypothetical protein